MRASSGASSGKTEDELATFGVLNVSGVAAVSPVGASEAASLPIVALAICPVPSKLVRPCRTSVSSAPHTSADWWLSETAPVLRSTSTRLSYDPFSPRFTTTLSASTLGQGMLVA